MKDHHSELIEVFLQEASDRLQFLREFSSILLETYPSVQELERLYISAHTLAGTAASYAFPLFAEIAGKLAHVFQYAMNATIASDAAGPLVEFMNEAVALLETDLIMIGSNQLEAVEDVNAFKQRYPFAFQAPAQKPEPETEVVNEESAQADVRAGDAHVRDTLLDTHAEDTSVEDAPDAAANTIPERDPLLATEDAFEPEILAEDAEVQPEEEIVPDPNLISSGENVIAPQSIVYEREEYPLQPEPYSPPLQQIPVAISNEIAPEEFAGKEPELAPGPQAETPLLPADDDVPAEILEFFVPEVEEHLQVVTHCLLSLETNPGEAEVHRLLRSMHTIKGSAAQVGLHRISKVAHRAEDLIIRLRDGQLQPSPEIIDICLESVDILKKFLHREWTDDTDIQAAVQPFFARVDRLIAQGVEAGHRHVSVSSFALKQETAAAPERQLSPEEEALLAEYAQARQFAAEAKSESAARAADESPSRGEAAAAARARSVRVELERLDRMMNAVGELVIHRTQMLGRLAELERLAEVLNFSKARMTEKVAEFQEKYEFGRLHSLNYMSGLENSLRRSSVSGPVYSIDQSMADFSELEMDRYDDFNILSRSLTEISADVSEVLTQLDGFVRRVNGDIDSFTKVAHHLQDEIAGARMVPIGNLYTRLSRTVRDAAKAAGKQVELALAGAETELDNNIVQRISDPLIHLVRNAVAHGIERDDERYQAGKDSAGRIAVRAGYRGNHIFVEVEDDGRGIDYEKVRQTAVESGLIYPEKAAELSEAELLEMLFQPGFSTAPRKTELAGRGVGLDVVRSNLAQLNGEIDVNSVPGQGTKFTLKVPLTLIISQALFVRCGAAMFAIPVTLVEEIRRIKEEEIYEEEGRLQTKVRDSVLHVVRVDATLGLDPIQPINDYYRMVIAHSSAGPVGLIVEDVVRKDEIVVKGLGEYLSRIKMFPGATIAPDGSLVLMIDVNRIVACEALEHDRPVAANAARVFAPGSEAVAQREIPEAAIESVEKEKVIVLVDDSISVRKFVGRMLEKAGYRVQLACDGLEAMDIVARVSCELVITDLEMPHANGYELLAHLRQTPETRSVPVMIVTSRAGAKHRERAMKEGASAFLTKPVQEEQFLAAVGRLIGAPAGLAAERSALVE